MGGSGGRITHSLERNGFGPACETRRELWAGPGLAWPAWEGRRGWGGVGWGGKTSLHSQERGQDREGQG